MVTPLAELGQNTEIDENSSGETIIRNTQTGTEIRLADFVDIVGPLGDSSNPIAGTSHFESLSADVASIGNVVGRIYQELGSQTINTATVTQIEYDTTDIEDTEVVTADLTNNKITITENGKYLIKSRSQWRGSANWSLGDRIQSRIDKGGTTKDVQREPHTGANEDTGQIINAVISVTSAPVDIEVFVFHERGGDEELAPGENIRNLSVVRLG